MIYVGVDCGKHGVIAVLDGTDLEFHPFPTVQKTRGSGRDYDIMETDSIIYHIQARYPQDQLSMVIEDPGGHAPSASGLKSMTEAFMMIRTIATTRRIRHFMPMAGEWQRSFWKKPKMPKGQKFNTKAAALKVAREIWPWEEWLRGARCTKIDDNMVDAALIAEYGRRKGL